MTTSDDSSWIEEVFPRLNNRNYSVTSPKTRMYNCFAWAAGDDSIPWEPFNAPYTFWPHGIRRDCNVKYLINAYESIGYVLCDDGELKDGWEKVALYSDPLGEMQHAARQLENGLWTSKLGGGEDVTHNTPEDVVCKDYGEVSHFMERRRS